MNEQKSPTDVAKEWCTPDRPTGVVVAIATAAVATLVAATIIGELLSDPRPSWTLLGLDIAVGVLGCAVLPVLFWRPPPTAVGLAALAALSPAATPLSTVGALHVARVRRFPMAVAVAGAGIVGHAILGAWRPRPGLAYGWWLVLDVAVYAALVGWGTLAQARAALITSLRERARRVEAEQAHRIAEARLLERTRIAREMHDVLAHRLSLLTTYAGALEFRPDAPPEQISRAAAVIRAGAHQALEKLREVIGVLRGDDLVDHEATEERRNGAAASTPPAGSLDASTERPQPTLADVWRLVDESREAGVQVDLDTRVLDASSVPASTGRTAYRIVQEGLTNAHKHAQGQPVRVAVAGSAGSRLVIDIRNPLADGLLVGAPVPGSGTGLIGLSERVHLAGGEVDHALTTTGEFRLHASLPWPQ
jgi:signal transduction histidine kinase